MYTTGDQYNQEHKEGQPSRQYCCDADQTSLANMLEGQPQTSALPSRDQTT